MGLSSWSLGRVVLAACLTMSGVGPVLAEDDCPDPLFSCSTNRQDKTIRICATERVVGEAWENVQYRFGKDGVAADLVFPLKAGPDKPPMYFSHFKKSGEYHVNIRFANGAYVYRVYSIASRDGFGGDAGVTVSNQQGKLLATVHCNERPYMFPDYLRLALPCDEQDFPGKIACQKRPHAIR